MTIKHHARILAVETRQLYAELLYCIAQDVFTARARCDDTRRYTGSRHPEAGQRGQLRHDDFMGAFEVAHEVLASFPAVIVPSPSFVAIELNVDVAEITEAVLRDFPEEVPTLDAVLAAFIGVAVHYGRMNTSRSWFQPHPDYARVFELLSVEGYLGRLEGLFRWTDKARAAMVACYQWPEDGIPHVETREAELDVIWATMPQQFRREVFLGESVNTITFAIAYSTCWMGDHWDLSKMQKRESGKTVLSGGGADICNLLVERFVKPMRRDM